MTLNRRRWGTSCAALLVACVALAGCGSGGGSSSAGTVSASGLAKARQEVTSLEAVTTSYPVPTAKIPGAAGLHARTVYYIPLVQQIPGFVVTADVMKQALATVGLTQQVCDGQGQPSAIAACVQQAIAANAAGIVLDAIPYGMAQNALDAAKARGVPIIIADQLPPSGIGNTDQVSYVPGATSQPSAIAWWLIADSQGKANVIIAEEADSPSSQQYVTDSLPIYRQYCPACTVNVKTITATTDALLASATSSNILTHPGAGYYYTEFEDSLQPTVQGIQQSGRAASLSLSVAGGSVNGLGLLKGNSVVKAVVAVDQAYAGYALTDEMLRMMTRSATVAEPYPTRLFTKQNIDSIQVTTAAQATGEWFGDTSFRTDYAKLWGVG